MQKPWNTLALRLTVWFLLLSFLPLGVMAVFTRRDVASAFFELSARHQHRHAVALASDLSSLGDDAGGETDVVQSLLAANSDADSVAFVVDESGVYVAHSDEAKAGGSAFDDFSAGTVAQFLTGGDGTAIEVETGRAIGYAAVPGQGTTAVVVMDGRVTSALIAEVEKSFVVQLGISLIIVSITAGAVIWSVVGRPIRQLIRAADEIGAGNLDVSVNPDDMEDELKLLAHALNHMAERLQELVGGLERQMATLEQAEARAIRAKKEWERTFDVVPDPIAVIDDRHRILRANKAMADKMGVTPREAVGLTCYEIVHGTDGPPPFCPHVRLLADGQEHAVEVHEERLGGYFIVTVSPIHDAAGRLIGSVHVAHDITARKRMEEALRENERFLQSVFDGIQDGISVLDTDLSILQVNTWMERMYASQAPLQGKKCYAVYQQRESPCPWCPSLPVLKTGEAHSEVVPYPSKEDPAGWIDLSAFPLKDSTGRIVGVIEHVKDITRQVQAEDELRHYTGRLETMREIDQAILAARSPEEIAQAALRHIRRLVPCRRADITLFDFEADEAILFVAQANDTAQMAPGTRIPLENMGDLAPLRRGGVRVVRDILNHTRFPVPPAMAQMLSAEGVRSFVNVPLLAQGELIGTLNVGAAAPEVFAQQHLDTMREVADQLAIAIQNTRLQQELQRHADELAAAVTRLQELDHLKSEFIQNVSHELRTPLALVRGYAELLDDGEFGELTSEQRKSIAVIARRTRMLSSLVEDITLILEMESRQLELGPVPLGELARAAVDDFRVKTEEMRLALHAEIAPDLPPVSGDTVHLRRVLDNLLGNAVKFTPAGGTITVRVRSEGDQVILEVADTGIGIPPDQQERIFERFYQVNGSTSRKYGGVGLGLALVKEIVEASGGQVRVESEEGVGSTFIVALPALEAEGAE